MAKQKSETVDVLAKLKQFANARKKARKNYEKFLKDNVQPILNALNQRIAVAKGNKNTALAKLTNKCGLADSDRHARRLLHVKKGLDDGKLKLDEVLGALDQGLHLHLLGQLLESQVVTIVNGERVKRSPNRGEVLHRLKLIKVGERGEISRVGERLGIRGKRPDSGKR